MSEKNEDGGPAFPVEVQADGDGFLVGRQTSNCSGFATGISVRDYFAAKAMAGAVASTPFDDEEGNTFSCSDSWYADLAYHSYRIADAMLKARAK